LFGVKYHCEFAGLGIEYSWGKGKLAYRRLDSNVKTPGNLQKNVENCLFTEISLTRVFKFARRARDYERYIVCIYVKMSIYGSYMHAYI
jgi:hypothetical protein